MTLGNPCRAVRDLLERSACGLLDGPGSAADRERLDRHLQTCEPCRDVLARERVITGSLDALSNVRAALSVEDRVMAAVRTEAKKSSVRRGLSSRQKAVLGGAALAATIGEALFWAALALLVLRLPGPTVLAPLQGLTGPALTMLTASLDAGVTLGRAGFTVLSGLALLLPPPQTLAALFVSTVSLLTFIAVRRDLHRSPAAARGLR